MSGNWIIVRFTVHCREEILEIVGLCCQVVCVLLLLRCQEGFKSLSRWKIQRTRPGSLISSIFTTTEGWVLSAGQCDPVRLTLYLFVFPSRFILVFSCLVLSVFSTIPAHQDFSSYCLLILVRSRKDHWPHLRGHFKPLLHRAYLRSSCYKRSRLLDDLWCDSCFSSYRSLFVLSIIHCIDTVSGIRLIVSCCLMEAGSGCAH